VNEVRRGFCRPGTSFVSYTSVAVQCLLGAGPIFPYNSLFKSSGAVRVMSPYTVILLTAGCGPQKPWRAY